MQPFSESVKKKREKTIADAATEPHTIQYTLDVIANVTPEPTQP